MRDTKVTDYFQNEKTPYEVDTETIRHGEVEYIRTTVRLRGFRAAWHVLVNGLWVVTEARQ